MKKYLKWAAMLLGVAAFFLGVNFLYTFLSARYDAQNIAVNESQADVEAEQASSEAQDDPENQETAPAPDFTVVDADGSAVHRSDFTGKPLVVNFWASWCSPCKSEMPDFNEAYAAYRDDVQFMMVNLTDGSRETLESAKAYIEEQGYDFPVYYDVEQDAACTYAVSSIPTTYFFDADGVAVAKASGAIDGETLEYGISLIFE